jgi:hypothetical protein
MFRATSTLRVAAATIAAASVIAACGSTSPGSPTSNRQLSAAQLAREQQDAVKFAGCMRSHGVSDIPDPTLSPRGFKSAVGVAVRSPSGQAAYEACERLLPPGQHSQTPAYSPARTAALLAFARCLRGHGFPNFPDPNGSGNITHEMLASAGINLHQPGLVQAADTCVSVTHGLLTKADVARFAAGQ